MNIKDKMKHFTQMIPSDLNKLAIGEEFTYTTCTSGFRRAVKATTCFMSPTSKEYSTLTEAQTGE